MKLTRKKNKVLSRLDREIIWHPFTQMRDYENEEPLIIARAKGNYLYDTYGKKYLDAISSLWVTVHGHVHPAITRAIKDQADLVAHSTLLGISNIPAIELADKLLAIAPKNLRKVFYSDNGSTAVEIALKMAYQYHAQTEKKSHRTKFITFTNAYHGDTLGSVSVGGIDLFHKVYKPLILKNIVSDFENIEKNIRTHHRSAAAVIIEPMIQGAAGMLLQPSGFLKKLRRLCDQYGLILIFDEVATGFGRTGKMFACEHDRVMPDILCCAKGLSGGYLPLAATLTTQKIYDGFLAKYEEFKTFFHGHTFTGNPLACAAAIANLETFKKEKTLAKISPKIRLLKKMLEVFAKHDHVKEVRQLGLMAGIEICLAKKPLIEYDPGLKMGAVVCRAARKHGILLRPLGNTIVFMPPLSITAKEIKRLVEVTQHCIEEECG